MRTAERIANLHEYIFAAIDRKVAERRAAGVDVISLGVGDPDKPTPAHIVAAMQEAVADPATHRYPSYFGLPEFRGAVSAWYGRRFGVTLDPDTEVQPLIGSKEGIANISVAFVDPGDVALVPSPGYPVYGIGTLLAGGSVHELPCTAANGFRPDFDVPADALSRAKILWLNYPSNPTSAVADLEFFARAVDFARDHDLLVAHDAAYTEIGYDGYVSPSILEVPGAKDVAVEFHSLSKTYNMTGWRIGWACGSPVAVEALGRVKTNVDSGIFNAVQRAGIAALDGPQDCVAESVALYQSRCDRICRVFEESGWDFERPKGGVFVWLRVPDGHTSASFTEFLLDRAGVVVAPGSGYGATGEGYIRLSLTVPDDRLDEAVERVGKALRDA